MTAEKIYKSKHIYTVTHGMLDGGVAVAENRILAVEPMDQLKAYVGKETDIIDFGEKLLMPGFVDGHTHMMAYAPKVDMSDAESVGECVELVRSFYEKNKDADCIRGEKWFAANWDGTMPGKKDIDAVVPDKPFLAVDLDIHKVWVNTFLLEEMGIRKETINQFCKGNPEMISVDEDGEPTGLLSDQVAMEVTIRYGVPTTDETVKGMLDVWTQYGVTAVNDMDFYTADCEMYQYIRKFEEEGKLNVRVYASLDAEKATDASIDYGKKFMDSDMFRLNALKAFMDGTGAGMTAFMLKPYKGTDIVAKPFWSREQLLGFVKMADRHNLAMHTHCCGDAAVRMVLDVYEQAQADGVQMNEIFSIEHCDTVADADVKRPAKLGISLNLTPDFLAPTKKWKDNPYFAVYDDEVQKELWHIRSFVDTGVNVSFGTDYTASSMNPMDQLYRAVERKANDGNPTGGYMPEEKLSLEEAVRCYTVNSAKSVGMGEKLGSLDTGKYADMIVLDRNIFEVSLEEVKKTKVLVTIVNGSIIYKKE